MIVDGRRLGGRKELGGDIKLWIEVRRREERRMTRKTGESDEIIAVVILNQQR